MSPIRRAILRSLSVGVVGGLTGCVGTRPLRPEAHVADWHDEPVRGGRPGIAVERAVEVPPALGDQCGWEAADAVETAVTTRLESTESVRIDYTKTTALPDAGWIVIVYREVLFGPEGRIREVPDVSFESVRRATPTAVTVTVRNGDETRTCRYAVYVGDTYQQMD